MIYNTTKRIPEKMSALGLGTWNFGGGWDHWDEEKSIRIVHAALDAGMNVIDTAPLYGNGVAETLLGKALKHRRDKVFLATKGGRIWTEDGTAPHNLTKKSLLWEVDRSLMRLQTDYIDLYHLHWPDPDTPLEETAEALTALRQSGKVKYLGLSNFSPEDSRTLMELVGIDSQQNLYNMLERNSPHYRSHTLAYRTEKEIFPLVREFGQAFFPFLPLFQGLLAGRFFEGRHYSEQDERAKNPKLQNEELYQIYLQGAKELNQVANSLGKPLVQLSLNWLRSRPEVTSIIAGVSTVAQLEENLGSLEWELDQETLDQIEKIIAPFQDL